MESLDYLKNKGIKFRILQHSEAPKTAQDVERIYGCPLHQVLKTLVFVGEQEPVIVVLPGDSRVDMDKLMAVAKQNLRMAKPDEVLEITGYKIGGVSPFGMEKHALKIIDESVFRIKTVNLGSGIAEIGIELDSSELKKDWDGVIAGIIQ